MLYCLVHLNSRVSVCGTVFLRPATCLFRSKNMAYCIPCVQYADMFCHIQLFITDAKLKTFYARVKSIALIRILCIGIRVLIFKCAHVYIKQDEANTERDGFRIKVLFF